jgi:hypothetical protein
MQSQTNTQEMKTARFKQYLSPKLQKTECQRKPRQKIDTALVVLSKTYTPLFIGLTSTMKLSLNLKACTDVP